MRIESSGQPVQHLSYCSNIHAGESWPQVKQNLELHLPTIRSRLAADQPFGIGLRLSAAAVQTLAAPDQLQDFQQFLADNNYYVFTINAFPYGAFHGTRVKRDVYLPDWLDPERLRYSNQTADVFANFLPNGVSGSISTVPGAFKANVMGTAEQQLIANNLISHAAHLVNIERQTGKAINLALEPEPCCFLETIDESVSFFHDYLYSRSAITQLANATDTSLAQAEQLLHQHLTLCFDICHAAVEFENPQTAISKLQQAGIAIGKLQISAGLRLQNVTASSVESLRPFDDDVYLHQVVERIDNKISRFEDLSEAFTHLQQTSKTNSDTSDREWRVHFHVPIFHHNLGDFSSTQFFIRELLAIHKETPLSEHLEVETYTWDVLPKILRDRPIEDAIVEEINWVREQLV